MKKPLILFVLTLPAFLVSAFSVYRYSAVTVFVNGQRTSAVRYEQLGALLERRGIPLDNGALLDVRGKVLQPEGGPPPEIYIDGKSSDAGAYLRGGEKITITGRNAVERIETVILQVDQPHRVRGHGSLIILLDKGVPARKEVTRGAVSGIVLKEKVLNDPRAASFIRERDGQDAPAVKNAVALTFDDGPNASYTLNILDILKKYNVKATFFVVGSLVYRYPAATRRIVWEGHTIGNHSYDHLPLTRKSFESVRQGLAATGQAVKNITGKDMNFFRPPWGELSANIVTAANSLELQTILWDVDPSDWRKPPPEELIRRVVSYSGPGDVVLLHDGGGDRSRTVGSLPGVIEYFLSNGYEFVTLDQLITKP